MGENAKGRNLQIKPPSIQHLKSYYDDAESAHHPTPMATIFHFNDFELDLQNKELSKGQVAIKLKHQPFRLLELLVTHPGQLVTREEIRTHLWPPEIHVDFDQGVNRCIKEIREALGDDAEAPRYVDTRQGLGYCFIAHVTQIDSAQCLPDKRRGSIGRFAKLSVAVLMVVALAILLVHRNREVALVELTSNSSAQPITAAAISPDGERLAYADATGIYWKAIRQGKTYALPGQNDSRTFSLTWSPDSSLVFVSSHDKKTHASGLSAISLLDNSLAKVRDNVGPAAVSPEGSRIALISGDGKELWLTRIDGQDPQQLSVASSGESFQEVAWFASGRQLVLGRLRERDFIYDVSIEAFDLTTRKFTTIISNPGLRSSCILGDGHIIYSVGSRLPNEADSSIWEITISGNQEQLPSRPKLITKIVGADIYALSSSADGRHVAFLKGPYQADVYVGELEEYGSQIVKDRRLTQDDSNDLPTGWTSDSSAVIFHSDRSGNWQIFKQGMDKGTPEVIIAGPQDSRGARGLPSGSTILYYERPKEWWKWLEPVHLMRAPIMGGIAQEVLTRYGLFSFRCSRAPASLCVLSELEAGQMIFYLLDPTTGQGHELARTTVEGSQHNWDLSPDGSRIAVTLEGQRDHGQIRILTLSSGAIHDIAVDKGSGFQSLDWSADGNGFYVSSRASPGANLLYVNLDGHSRVLRYLADSFETWGVPSPDGRHLAFLVWTSNSNAWMLDR